MWGRLDKLLVIKTKQNPSSKKKKKLNQGRKRAASKPQTHQLLCVCKYLCTCSHGGCEMPRGMLLPRSHHVSEGEITPNRHTPILSPLPYKPQGAHRVLSHVFMALIQRRGLSTQLQIWVYVWACVPEMDRRVEYVSFLSF